MRDDLEVLLIENLERLIETMSALSDAVAANTASVTALTNAVANNQRRHRCRCSVTQLTTNNAAIDSATTTLGGTPPSLTSPSAPESSADVRP